MTFPTLYVILIYSGNHLSCSSTDTGVSGNEAAPVDSTTALPSGEGAEQISRPSNQSGTIVTALAQAGNTLSQAQAELVLNPLRLAFETKNGKIMELALDCLHVGSCCCTLAFFWGWTLENLFFFVIYVRHH